MYAGHVLFMMITGENTFWVYFQKGDDYYVNFVDAMTRQYENQ